jgi:hypothetical protein
VLQSTTRDYAVVVNHDAIEGDVAVWLRPLFHASEDDYTPEELEALVLRGIYRELRKEEN